jgi:hypothetical protein
MSRSLPPPLLELAEAQLGVLSRRQLRTHLGSDLVDGLVRHGHLARLERGIYRIPGGAPSPQQLAVAAALRAGPNATLTGPIVLAHHRVDGIDPSGAPFEVLLGTRRQLYGVSFPWRPDPNPSRRTTSLGEVRLATVDDALVHSVRWRTDLGDRALRLACDWLGWRGLLDRDRFLQRLVARAAEDPAADELLTVLGGDTLGRCESDGERVLGAVATRFEPAPEPQVWLPGPCRADWYFRELRLVLEFDGRVDHTSEDDRSADAARDAQLAEHGVVVVRVTPDELSNETALVGRLALELTLRAHELGVPAPTYDPARAA